MKIVKVKKISPDKSNKKKILKTPETDLRPEND